MKGVEKEIAGAVPGERASRAIAAVGRGSEADDKDLRMWIAEAWNRLTPIVAVQESTALSAGNGLAIAHEARALAAGNDFVVKDLQFFRWIHDKFA